MIERAVVERKRTGVGYAEGGTRVARARLGVSDIRRHEVDTLHRLDAPVAHQLKGEAARAATNVEHAPRGYFGKFDEKRCEATTPAPHLRFVAIAVGGEEGRGGCHERRATTMLRAHARVLKTP